jgi:hypothetical protein
VITRSFADWDEALDYAIARQRDRRNLSRTELAAFVARALHAKDKRQEHGGDRRSADFKASNDALKGGKSSAEAAEQLGVSQATVERTRAVLASPPPPRRSADEFRATGQI